MNVSVCSDWAYWFFFLCSLSLGRVSSLCGSVISLKGSARSRAALEEWNRQLALERASLADPQRIDTLARRDLGLSLPQPQQVIRLEGAAPAAEASSAEFARNLPASNDLPREP